ncbi:hypothetical protein Tco_0451598 [Tanacetum coccineum]
MGISPIASASASAKGHIPPKTAKQKLARINELKAKSTLMLAISDEHILKFHACKDAKSLWEAIKNSQEGLDKTYDRFQKLISQIEIHGEVVSQEDANMKLLRSLPSAWNNITLIMRNKSDLDTLSMDDLYNNLKVYKSEIKGQSTGVDEEEVLEEPDSTKVEVKQEGNTESTRKRPGRRLKMKATKKSKRQKTDSDLEEEEQLKAFLMIVPDEEGEIDYEVLDKRYPIVDWESKFYHTDRYGKPHDYYRVFRADGSSRYIKTFTEMVSRFDRLDFIELHSLVMKRFETSTPEGIDLILWGSLRTMFEANAEDDLWKNQEEWILKSWNFYDNCGVHILVLEDGTEFYMLAERRYPLTKETLERMLALRLIAESESEAVFDLLRFIQQQINESGSHDGSEKDL